MLTYLNIISVLRLPSYEDVPHCSNKEQTNQYGKRHVQKIFHKWSGVTKQAFVLNWLLLYQLKEKRSELCDCRSQETKHQVESLSNHVITRTVCFMIWPWRPWRWVRRWLNRNANLKVVFWVEWLRAIYVPTTEEIGVNVIEQEWKKEGWCWLSYNEKKKTTTTTTTKKKKTVRKWFRSSDDVRR